MLGRRAYSWIFDDGLQKSLFPDQPVHPLFRGKVKVRGFSKMTVSVLSCQVFLLPPPRPSPGPFSLYNSLCCLILGRGCAAFIHPMPVLAFFFNPQSPSALSAFLYFAYVFPEDFVPPFLA